VSFGHTQRDGFTNNLVTGNDLDYRESTSGKAQLLWTPTASWEARVIVNAERARDGDYALSDLGGLRQTEYETARDFEGRTDRDIFSTSVLTRREGSRFAFSTTTGIVRWKTQDVTDLDYTPLPLIRRDNTEETVQFTQEVRLASAPAAWLAGRWLPVHAELRAAGVERFLPVRAAVHRLSGAADFSGR
jgi:iron complex outermembrane receptor protein